MLYEQLEGRRAYTAYGVERDEFPGADDVLNHTAEDVEGVHIEQYMPEPSVHIHICDELPPMEVMGLERIQGEQPEKDVRLECHISDKCRQKQDDVDDDYIYVFSGWDKELEKISENTTYTAQFDAYKKYTITINRADESVEEIFFSELNVSEILEQIEITESTDEIKYYWENPLPTELELKDYTFTEKIASGILVRFCNYDGTLLETYENNDPFMPEYKGEDPIREMDDENFYFFAGWDKEIVLAEELCDYIATFRAETKYTITIERANGEIENIYFCESNKAEKVKEIINAEGCIWADEQTTPTELELQDYYLKEIFFEKIVVRFLNEDGTVLKTYESDEPFTPNYDGESPKKEMDDENFYFFNGWDKDIEEVSESCDYTATFRSETKYTITIHRFSGKIDYIYFCDSNKAEKVKEIVLTPDKPKIDYEWKEKTVIPTTLELKNYEFYEICFIGPF